MTDISEPISNDFFDEDLHKVNQEIIRLAYFLNIDISDEKAIHQLVTKELPSDHEHFHKLETLRGLILLRGHIRLEREESGIPDGIPPSKEEIYKLLHQSSSIDTSQVNPSQKEQ